MRAWLLALAACGYPKLAPIGGDDDGGIDACVGLQCQVTLDCAMQGKPETTLSGVVLAANGTTPLYNVTVYVPNTDPGPVPVGAQCARCTDPPPGSPVVKTTTDEAGKFDLVKVPAGDNIPVVIALGKWQRRLSIPHVEACTEATLDQLDTKLPSRRGDFTANTTLASLPKIAVSTGPADAMECLVRKLGIDDTEIGTLGSGLAVELFAEPMVGVGANAFATGFPGGSGAFASSLELWSHGPAVADHVTQLQQYDAVILSCEGAQNNASKLQDAMDAMKTYADLGGRIFAAHWHNIWIEGATTPAAMQKPATWPNIIAFTNSSMSFGGVDDIIDESTPKGVAFANWMQNLVPAATRGHIAIQTGTGRDTVDHIVSDAVQLSYWPMGVSTNVPQSFAFTTPVEQPVAQRCGKVAFSDMHPASGSQSTPGMPFPTQCSTAAMTPQELGVAYVVFDLLGCVGP